MAGLPSDLNTDEMRRVCETCSDLDLQPMTVISALLRTDDEVFLFTCPLLFLRARVQPTLWTHTLRPFYNRPIVLTQEGRSLVNDVCKCVSD